MTLRILTPWQTRDERLSATYFPFSFPCFLLLNAILFIRPGEIIPAIAGWPIYEVVMVLFLLSSLTVLQYQLKPGVLITQAMLVCVILLLPAIAFSQLAHGNLWEARAGATEFVKVVLYYLLLVSLVDSPARLRTFLLIIAGFTFVMAVVSLAQ